MSELGQRMSSYELNVIWPAYFASKQEYEGAMSRDQFDAELERGS